MSITKLANQSKKSDRIRAALALANTVQRRRENLQMSIERAADLADIKVSEWCALEAGWVPSSRCIVHAVADTLDIGYIQLWIVAEISEYNHTNPV